MFFCTKSAAVAFLIPISFTLISCGGGGGSSKEKGETSTTNLNDTVQELPIVPDTTPDDFVLATKDGVELGVWVESDSIVIKGINQPTSVQVTNGEYSISGGAFRSSSSQITAGQTIAVRTHAPNSFSTSTKATVTIGGIARTFEVFTLSADRSPDSFTFVRRDGVNPATWIESNVVTIVGINDQASISVQGGEYSVDGGAYVTTEGTVSAGHAVRVRVLSASRSKQESDVTLTVGDYTSIFQVTTLEDEVAPQAMVRFPIGNILVQNDFITIRGTANDASGIAALSVNGIQANSNNQYASWEATVPLTVGSNTLMVTVTDNAGNSSNEIPHVNVERQAFMDWPISVALDLSNQTAFVVDSIFDSIYKVNLENGNRTLLSDSGTGVGTPLQSPWSIVLDPSDNRALVADSSTDAIHAVDILTGNRTIVSGVSLGSGIGLAAPFDIDFDAQSNAVYVVDASLKALLRVDLNTGDRSIVSNSTRGAGTAFRSPIALALDLSSNRAFVVDDSADLVFAVDLSTGDRAIVSGGSTGSGPILVDPGEVVIDKENNRLLLLEAASLFNPAEQLDSLVSIDLTTGNRQILSGRGVGNGPELQLPQALALDKANNRALVGDLGSKQLIWIDLNSGNRSILSSSQGNYEKSWKNPGSLVSHSNSRQLLIGDSGLNELLSINLDNGTSSVIISQDPNNLLSNTFTEFAYDHEGNRIINVKNMPAKIEQFDLVTGMSTLVADSATGSGAAFNILQSPQFNIANNHLFVVNVSSEEVLDVDLASGNRTIIAAPNVGSGARLVNLESIVLDVERSRLILADVSEAYLLGLDVGTGNRTILSDAFSEIGEGPGFSRPEFLNFDSPSNRIFLFDTSEMAIMSVDLATGDRAVLVNKFKGIGPVFSVVTSMAVDFEKNLAFVTDSQFDWVTIVDLESGDRAVLFP